MHSPSTSSEFDHRIRQPARVHCHHRFGICSSFSTTTISVEIAARSLMQGFGALRYGRYLIPQKVRDSLVILILVSCMMDIWIRIKGKKYFWTSTIKGMIEDYVLNNSFGI